MKMMIKDYEARFGSKHECLPETNGLHLKMDGWNTNFLSGCIFRGYVSFRECNPTMILVQS